MIILLGVSYQKQEKIKCQENTNILSTKEGTGESVLKCIMPLA